MLTQAEISATAATSSRRPQRRITAVSSHRSPDGRVVTSVVVAMRIPGGRGSVWGDLRRIRGKSIPVGALPSLWVLVEGVAAGKVVLEVVGFVLLLPLGEAAEVSRRSLAGGPYCSDFPISAGCLC